MRTNGITPRRAALRRLCLRGLGLVLLLSSLLLPLACGGREEAADAWYPLDGGHLWRYRVTVQKGGETQRMQLMLRNLPGKNLEGVTVTPQRTIFGPHGTVLFVRADEAGVSQIGEASP